MLPKIVKDRLFPEDKKAGQYPDGYRSLPDPREAAVAAYVPKLTALRENGNPFPDHMVRQVIIGLRDPNLSQPVFNSHARIARLLISIPGGHDLPKQDAGIELREAWARINQS